jgi:hypothetical protein
MAVGDVYQLTRHVILNGQDHVNVLHFQETAGAPAQDKEEFLAFAFDPGTAEPVAANRPDEKFTSIQRGYTSVAKVGLSVRRIFPTVGETYQRQLTSTFSAAVDDGLPTFCQQKVLLATDLISRSGRGGFHIGGIPETYTTGNVVTHATQILRLDDLITAIINVHTASGSAFAGYVIGVFSRLLLEFNAATVLSYTTNLGSMVSRRLGQGT